MRRREFLGALALGPLAGALAGTRLAGEVTQEQSPVRVMLVITGIAADTVASHLEAVLLGLVAGAVPVNLIVHPGTTAQPVMQPGSDIARLLRRFHTSFPGLVELIAWQENLADLRPFQKARAASDARASLTRSLWQQDEPDRSGNRIGTIACRQVLGAGSMAAVLSAGFQNVLSVPGQSSDAIAELNEAGMLNLLGGTRTSLPDASRVLEQTPVGLQSVLLVSALEISQTDPALLAHATAQLVEAIKRRELDQQIVTVRMRDLQMRTDAGFRRKIALHLFDPDPADPPAVAAMTTFRAMLDSARITYSTGAKLTLPTPGKPPLASAYWLEIPGNQAGQTVLGVAPAVAAASTAQTPGVAMVLTREPTARRGIDDGTTLHVPLLQEVDPRFTGMQSLLAHSDDATEGAITVEAAAILWPVQRTAILRDLKAITDTRVTQLLPLTTYIEAVLPKDPLFPSLLRTQGFALRTAPVLRATARERQDLRDDAQIAWRYFESATNRKTGLCPSTIVFGAASETGYASVTMWEVGSHINALMAASDLGLIADDDFTQSGKALLNAVDRVARARSQLPPETINSRTGRGTRQFNSYDTGRLLGALDRLRRHRLAFKGIEELVASWDFSKVIINRRLHSIKAGVLVDDYASNYTDYSAAAMRAWGYDVASPFDVMQKAGSADQRMALLYAAASHGPIGTEPTVLQLLEMGPSASNDFLADTLLSAMDEEHAASGQLLAPSETPLDRSPWFSYQGYRLDARTAPWQASVESDVAKHASPEFLADIRANSSKAAYLWRAMRPSPLSFQLTQMVRSVARSKNGFDSAIYVNSGKSTREYSDLNTNAVILQAIARIL